MTEAHPLRCETCQREHTDHLCNYRSVRLAERDKEFLEVVGCASHSSAKESSDKVLDELERNMVSYFDTGYASEDLKFIGDCFEKYRQQKEREQR